MKISHKSDPGKLRACEYPPVEEQLDMLWHGMNNGEIGKIEPFYSAIKAIKDKYPKGSKKD